MNSTSKIINDPLYGFISLEGGIILDLIEHPYFQRLRRISQLGLTCLVYPEIRNDTIDIEIRIYEGLQARINRVSVSGNSKTNDHVIIREIRTKPGDLFSRSDIMRSQREIATLNYFDPEKLNIDVDPNQEDGTVELNYIVEEKSSDKLNYKEAMV